jgi:metastasis-associated protein MTA
VRYILLYTLQHNRFKGPFFKYNSLSAGIVVPQPGPPAKRPNKEVGPVRGAEAFSPMMGRSVINHLNGKAKIATMTRSGSGRKQVISWMDAPDDVYFRSTDGTK